MNELRIALTAARFNSRNMRRQQRTATVSSGSVSMLVILSGSSPNRNVLIRLRHNVKLRQGTRRTRIVAALNMA